MSHKSNRPEQNPPSNPKKNGGKEDTTKRHVYIESGVQIDVVERLKKQHEAERGEDSTQHKKQLLWTRVTAVLVLIYTGIAFWQGCLTRKAVNNARQQSRYELQPWLKPQAIDITSVPAVNGEMRGEILLSNVGKTPASNIQTDIVVEILDNNTAPSLEYSMQNGHPFSNTFIGFMFQNESPNQMPGYISDPDGKPRGITQKEHDALINGAAYVVLYSRTTFDDLFGVHHWIHFCRWNVTGGRKEFQTKTRNCAEYNKSDNNTE